jgi:hypothetical protein
LNRKPERKRPLGKTRNRWEDNILIDLMEVAWEFSDWIHLIHDREQWGGGGLVNTVMNLRVP